MPVRSSPTNWNCADSFAESRAVLADIFQEDRDIDIILQSVLIFLVRRSVLEEILDRKDIDELINNGLLRQILDKSGESMFVVRLPELLAAELATELANNAVSQMKAKENPAEWLSKASRMLPFGDVITLRPFSIPMHGWAAFR